jgi:hypothetical protein
MNRVVSIASMLSFFFLAGQAHATVTVIPQPDAAYKASTTKIDVASVPDFTSLNFITDGTLTVTFDTPLAKRTVPNNWATWSSPPASESATPAVLWTEGPSSLNMDLSSPAVTFGFELEPNPFSTEIFTVDFIFLNGPTIVGTISLSVNGAAGARLFAATTQDLPFNQVIINGTSDFAIAQVRYDLNLDVRIDIKPGSSKNPIKLSSRGVIPVVILSDSFDATTIDPSSVCFGDAEAPSQRDCTEAHGRGHLEDVDGDGDLDLVLHFDTLETGIDLGDTRACLTGTTFTGVPVMGCDAVQPQ